jgi:predicted enzyme related to lactoylglutathione lyase
MTPIETFKSVVLTSRAPEATARFYRDVLAVPLEPARHRGTLRHWACQVGDIHLAVHDRDGFWLPVADGGARSTVVSFNVPDLDAFDAHLSEKGVGVVARTMIGPMSFLAIEDPDGRLVCVGTPWPSRPSP